MSTNVRARRDGLSLIEIQIAMMILLLGVLTVLAMTPTGLLNSEHSQNATQSVNYARHLLESTMALQFEHQYSTPTIASETYDLSTIFPIAPGTFSYRINVKPVVDPISGAADDRVHSIEVMLYWVDRNANGGSSTHSVEVVSYSANPN